MSMNAAARDAGAAALADRLARVEPLRRAARRTEALRLAAYAVAALGFLVLLPVTAVGSMWLLGNFVTQDLLIVVPAMLASVAGLVALAILAFKRLTRWRATPEAAYRAAFREQVIVPTLREALPGFVVDGTPAIDAAGFDASGLFAPAGDRRDVTLALDGMVDGQRLRVWVLRVWRPGYSGDRDQAVDVTIFRGLLVHAPAARALARTVRVVSRPDYEACVLRRRGTVRVGAPVEGLPPEAALVLDAGETEPPPAAAALVRAWPALRAAMDAPVFASVHAGGLHIAWAGPASHRLMLEPELAVANDPDRLAREAADVQRATQAAARAAATCLAA